MCIKWPTKLKIPKKNTTTTTYTTNTTTSIYLKKKEITQLRWPWKELSHVNESYAQAQQHIVVKHDLC